MNERDGSAPVSHREAVRISARFGWSKATDRSADHGKLVSMATAFGAARYNHLYHLRGITNPAELSVARRDIRAEIVARTDS